MKISNAAMTFAAAMILLVITAAGCQTKAAYHRDAELRWQKTLEQAKLDYAQQYFNQGQFLQATALLEPMTVSHDNPQAEVLLDKIEQSQTQYASAVEAAGPRDF